MLVNVAVTYQCLLYRCLFPSRFLATGLHSTLFSPIHLLPKWNHSLRVFFWHSVLIFFVLYTCYFPSHLTPANIRRKHELWGFSLYSITFIYLKFCKTFTCRRKLDVPEGFGLNESLTVPTVRAGTWEKEQGIYTLLLSARQLNAVASTVNWADISLGL